MNAYVLGLVAFAYFVAICWLLGGYKGIAASIALTAVVAGWVVVT